MKDSGLISVAGQINISAHCIGRVADRLAGGVCDDSDLRKALVHADQIKRFLERALDVERPTMISIDMSAAELTYEAEEALYRTRSGSWFIRGPGESITLLSDEQARDWLKCHGADSDLIAEYFEA